MVVPWNDPGKVCFSDMFVAGTHYMGIPGNNINTHNNIY